LYEGVHAPPSLVIATHHLSSSNKALVTVLNEIKIFLTISVKGVKVKNNKFVWLKFDFGLEKGLSFPV